MPTSLPTPLPTLFPTPYCYEPCPENLEPVYDFIDTVAGSLVTWIHSTNAGFKLKMDDLYGNDNKKATKTYALTSSDVKNLMQAGPHATASRNDLLSAVVDLKAQRNLKEPDENSDKSSGKSSGKKRRTALSFTNQEVTEGIAPMHAVGFVVVAFVLGVAVQNHRSWVKQTRGGEPKDHDGHIAMSPF